jgi:hypothetical protein
VEHMPQGALANQNHSGQRFVFDRADPALCVGIERLSGNLVTLLQRYQAAFLR